MSQITWHTKQIKIDDLIDYEHNPRRISKKDFDRLVNDIKQDGYRNRIVVNNDNTILGGHARKKALKAAGYNGDGSIEVLCASRQLTEEEVKRIIIRDNLSFGEYDFDILGNHFDDKQLVEWGLEIPDLSDIDQDGDALDNFAEPDITKQPTAKLGDIWTLGRHRLMCGDSTNAMQVQDLMKGIKPVLMVTDPPYGLNYNASWRERSNLEGGKLATGKVLNDDKADWVASYLLFPGTVAYVWHASLFSSTVQKSLESCGFKVISSIIWVKQHFSFCRGDYHWKHEPCWYVVKKGAKHNWQGARDQATVWEINNNNPLGNSDKEETLGHSTQKPIECMLRPILNNSAEGECVYDPFGGSGTTLIAAEKSNRNCLMMELSPHYCDVIIERWEKLTGQKAMQQMSV
jgi:DNA modification methylase